MNTILIADHHPITQIGISALLEQDRLYEVVGTVSTGKDLFKFLHHQIPDVVILEIDLPELTGLTALRTIKTEHPGTKILILSCHPEEMYALNAIKSGAAAYISKTASTETLKEAIRQVARGGIYLNKTLNDQINSGASRTTNLVSRYKKLSTREIEVLNLLSTGKRNKDIAEALDINEKTVSTYKTRLLKKLKVDNLADLINQSRMLQLKS